MEDDKINIQYEKNEFLYKIIYLIRINLPTSEYLYILMFFLKYIGLVLFSISLNIWKEADENIELNTINNKTSFANIQSFLSNFMINGNDLKILNKHYELICLMGFLFLLFYILVIIYGIIYMKSKYYNKNSVTSIDKKIKRINNSSIFQKRIFRIISYIFFFIIFFHQYIIEYYLFGFIGSLLYYFGFFDSESFNISTSKEYSIYINEYFKNLSMNPIFILIISLITIIIIFVFFIIFMLLNSTKTLFLNTGIPFYGNKKYLFIKIIIFNYNQLYGMLNMCNPNLKYKISLVINIISLVIILMDIFLTLYTFSFYPNNLSYICSFMEIFSLIAIIIEIIIYLTDCNFNLPIYKLIIEVINSFLLTSFYIYKKGQFNMNLFSENLFSKTFKKLNPDDIYYYFISYIKYKYSKNKKNNYREIFKLIQNHTLICDKKDCPCKILISKHMIFSPYTNFFNNKNEDVKNGKKDNFNIIEEKLDNNSKLLSDNINQINETNITDNNINNKLDNRKNKNIVLNKDTNNTENKKIELNKKISKENEKNVNSSLDNSKKNFKFNEIRDINNNQDINIMNNIKTKKNNNNEKKINNEKKELDDEQFIMLGEQEIINRIHFLYKRKNYDILQMYIFIHLQYLIKIRQNYRLALYFSYRYSLSGIKFSFLSRYFLYEIKKYITKSIMLLKNEKNIQDPYIIKYREENISMKKLINYISLYHMIKKLLEISCSKIIYFNTFKSEIHNSLSLQKYVKLKIYPIVSSAEEIQTSISKLKFLIEKYNKKENNHIDSIELCYLISNFFILIDGKISQDILENISPILYFKEHHYDNLENEFHLFMFSNPLIISLTKKDTFNINYFTNIFLDKLGYSYLDLKNKDFHEKLFPGEQELIKEHSYVMKQFLFFNNNTFSKTRTFLKSKDGYLIPINFTCKTFPNFSDNFLLISNIIFDNNSLSGNSQKIIEYNNKQTNGINININDHKIINNYFFLLNQDFEFSGLTENFYLEYELNHNLFRELRINFCQFFCVDENKLIKQIKIKKKKLIKNHPNLKNKISLKQSNKVYSIFQNIPIENTFKLRDENLLENFLYPSLFISDKIDKKKIVFKIPEIMDIIEENGLDYNWHSRLENFKASLMKNSNIDEIKNYDLSEISPSNRKKNFKKKQSTILSENNFESSLPEHFFEVVYSVKKLGGLPYYIVYLSEKINYDTFKIQIDNKKEEYNKKYISKDNTVIQNPIKYNSSKNIKTNSFISSRLNNNREVNADNYEINSIKRTSNTKVFSDFVSKKKSIPIGNFRNVSTYLNNPINSSKSIKNDSLQKLENNIQNKEETDKGDNNKNELNDKSKNQKIPKKNINKENSKKTKKNEYLEEDENLPLIERSKFTEKLIKNKKQNKILIIIINIVSIILIILAIIKFGLSEKGFSQTKSVLKATIYLEMLKIDIYVQAILSIIYCMNENENITNLSSIQSESKLKIKNTLEHLKILQDQINIILNNKNSAGIFNILQENYEILRLNDDWTALKEKVELMGELRSLSYKLYDLSNTNESCNINSFYEYEKFGQEIFKSGKVEKSNDIQKIIFYFLKNIFTSYKISFDKLSEESANTIIKMWVNYQFMIYCLLICIIILMTFFIIIYLIKVKFDYSYYKLLFLHYYHIESEQLKFENQIYYLYKTILEFNSDNIGFFEYAKSNSDLIEYNENKNSNYMNIIQENNNSISTKIDNNQKENNSLKNNSRNDKIKTLDKNSTAGSLLSGSINVNSFNYLNNSTSKKIFSRNNSINNDSSIPKLEHKEEEKKISQEETIDTFLNSSKKILPNTLKFSLIFISLATIIYFLLACGNIIELLSENNVFKYSINLSMNILERIPNLMGILIYTCFTIITGNTNLMELNQMNNNQLNYLTYFKTNTLYYSEDIMDKYFTNNYFGKLLKDTLRINYNFDNYLFQETNDIFTYTKEWEKLLNIKEYFCINAAIGEILSFQNEYTVYEFVKEVDYYATNCKEDNTGINESGIQLEINYILQEITNKFIEFITYRNYNITFEMARKNFFSSKDIKRIVVDMQLSLILYYNTITYTVTLDFEKKNNIIIKGQIVYSGFIFLVNFIIIIGLLFSITKNEKYKSLFGYFSEIPNINNR